MITIFRIAFNKNCKFEIIISLNKIIKKINLVLDIYSKCDEISKVHTVP